MGLDAAVPYQVYASLNQRAWPFVTLVVRSPLPLDNLAQTVQRAKRDALLHAWIDFCRKRFGPMQWV